jgi:hypothetical protein
VVIFLFSGFPRKLIVKKDNGALRRLYYNSTAGFWKREETWKNKGKYTKGDRDTRDNTLTITHTRGNTNTGK